MCQYGKYKKIISVKLKFMFHHSIEPYQKKKFFKKVLGGSLGSRS